MEKTLIYLTVTGKNLSQIKDELDLYEFDFYQKGDKDKDFSYMIYENDCLKLFNDEICKIDDYLYPEWVVRLSKLPKDTQLTIHYVKGLFDNVGSHGLHIDGDLLKDLVFINAHFEFSEKYCRLPMLSRIAVEHPCQVYTHISQKVYFNMTSYQIPLNEIIKKLAFNPNDNSFNYFDKRRCDCPYGFTSFKYKSMNKKDDIGKQLTQLANDLYPYKDNILSLGNDVDISYGINITGKMPNDYRIFIDKNTLKTLAKIRMSLDFDMYFSSF
ncbi:MAG: hypothetical protein Q4B81_07625 [Moraxella sp.]|nr:hypothetical protein [Moraxella sp.]